MESSESGDSDGGLTMKNVLWCGLLESGIPNKANTIRIVGGIFGVFVVGCHHQFRKNRLQCRRNIYSD